MTSFFLDCPFLLSLLWIYCSLWQYLLKCILSKISWCCGLLAKMNFFTYVKNLRVSDYRFRGLIMMLRYGFLFAFIRRSAWLRAFWYYFEIHRTNILWWKGKNTILGWGHFSRYRGSKMEIIGQICATHQ